MNYNQPWYPTYPSTMSGAQIDIQGVRWVSNINEVNAIPVSDDTKMMFMERTNSVFYIKQGSCVTAYKFEKIEPPKPEDFVTRTEFDELRRKYESLVQSVGQSATANTQPVVSTATVQSNAVVTSGAELSGNTGTGQAAAMPTNIGYGMDGTATQ